MLEIEMNGVRKKIDEFSLGPIDLTFEKGTITAIVGNNGAGKSTLLKLLMNLVKADIGEIHICGQSVSGKEENWKTKVAYLPQTVIGWELFNGKELQELVAKWNPTWDQKLFEQIVEKFHIPLNKKYSKLSQGMQQKLNIALLLPRDTTILILDEPTAHMDIPSKQLLLDLFVEWMERGDRLMLISSHQAEDIRKLADYLVIIKEGSLLGKFEKDELVERYKRYWMVEPLPNEIIPGEITRKNGRIIITSNPEETEAFFTREQLKWLQAETLDLEEIITHMLTNGGVQTDG
ncbi:ABC transporter ATP-binding protein [Bacillus sp. Bva_UNVM-123]|uniref:ATP-binding cassette domain-containing protein n=1 Tax=Bacillus sp. Bva_UNVM-123 TaxID=2829798 RepID=UPI00391F5C47